MKGGAIALLGLLSLSLLNRPFVDSSLAERDMIITYSAEEGKETNAIFRAYSASLVVSRVVKVGVGYGSLGLQMQFSPQD